MDIQSNNEVTVDLLDIYPEVELSVDLEEEIKVDERSHECRFCGKAFSRSCNLNKHLLRHTGKASYVCDICDASFSLKSSLTKHTLLHDSGGVYRCDVCSEEFKIKSLLIKHKAAHNQSKIINLAGKNYICEICGKTFLYKAYLTKHYNIHESKKLETNGVCIEQCSVKCSSSTHCFPCNKFQFNCDICKRLFVSERSLSSHRASHKSDGKSYICSICDRVFQKKNHFLCHWRVHQREKYNNKDPSSEPLVSLKESSQEI